MTAPVLEEAHLRLVRFAPLPGSDARWQDLFTGRLRLDSREWTTVPPDGRALLGARVETILGGHLRFVLARDPHPDATTYSAEVASSELVRLRPGQKLATQIRDCLLDLRIRHDGEGVFSLKVIGAGEERPG